MFVFVASFLFCATVLASPVDRSDLIYPNVETLISGEKRVIFKSHEQDVDITLEQASDLIADNFTITDGNDGKIHYSAGVDSFKWKLFRNKEKGAALHIDEDGPLEINGIINSKLRIKPYESKELIKNGKKAHRIIKVSSEKRHFNDTVIHSKVWKMFSDQTKKKLSEDQCIIIDYLILSESVFTNRFSNNEDIKVYLSLMMTGAQNLFDTLKLGIKIRLIAISPFKKENEPPFIENSAIESAKQILDPDTLLYEMSKYYCRHKYNQLVKRADIIMLITRRKLGDLNLDGSITTNTAGIANLGGACHPCLKCGIVADDDSYMERDDTFAHESAHLIGSPHDGDGKEDSLPGSPTAEYCPASDGFIMGDGVGKNKNKFSSCSRENIKYFLRSDNSECLFKYCNAENEGVPIKKY